MDIDDWTYVPFSNCSQSIFPLQNTTIFNARKIKNYLCPNLTTYQLWGDSFGSSYQYLDTYFYKCTGNSGCGTESEVTNYLHGANAHLVILNTYYDESDDANPIKQYAKYTEEIDFSENWWKIKFITIEPTQITFLNGSTTYSYEIGDNAQDSQTYVSDSLGELKFTLGSTRNKIIEYYLYQPSSTSRMLDGEIKKTRQPTQDKINFVGSTTAEPKADITEDSLYEIFNILAKIGGFYSFLNLVFGSISNFVNEILMKIDVIKKIKSKVATSNIKKMKLSGLASRQQSKIRPVSIAEESKRNYSNKNQK